MKKQTLLSAVCLGLSVPAVPHMSQAIEAPSRMQIIVNAPRATPAGSMLYLTGAIAGACNWEPDCLPMTRIGDRSFSRGITLPPGQTEVEVKITRGSWASELADSLGKPLANINLKLPADGKPIILSPPHWRDLPPLGVTGRLVKHTSFHSPQLGNDRVVRVWLPPGYDANPSQSYPVIYMHDGQNLFEPQSASFGVEWSIDETMTELVRSASLPAAIVVGVDHPGVKRFDEYTWSIQGNLYSDFLIDTVKPFIERTYRARKDRNSNFLMGSSMGAVISFSILWNRPDVFAAAAGLSLPAAIQNRAVFDVIRRYPAPKLPIRFYMDHGTAGMDESYAGPAQEFSNQLRGLGLAPPRLDYRVFKYAHHTEADWAARAAIPIRFLLSGVKDGAGRSALDPLGSAER